MSATRTVRSPFLRRLGVLVTGAALVAGALPASAAVAGVEPPRTGFEERGGQGWTTHDEELAFLEAVAAGSARAEVDVIGESVQGRPLHLVRVGHPTPPTVAEAAAGRTVLIICSQHGNEPAPREMCLQQLRDLAFDDDQTTGYLAGHAVMFIPTANPDGRQANTRGNADGVDVNRDHLNLWTPEGRAMGRVLQDLQPQITVDGHEMSGSTRPDIEVLWPRNLNVDEQVRALAVEMVQEWVRPGIEDAGYTSGLYPGASDERILRNINGLRHGVGMLTESNTVGHPTLRVATQLEAVRATLRFHAAGADEIADALAGARARKAAAGADQSEPFYFGGADNQPPGPTDVVDPPPCGYELTARQHDRLRETFGLFGIRVQPIDRERTPLDDLPYHLLPVDLPVVEPAVAFVSMAQPLMTVIPFLLDARASFNDVDGRPLEEDCPELLPHAGYHTGFEWRGGTGWTTHAEELEFLASVAAGSPRVALDVVGESVQGRPMQLVRVGAPAPPTVEEARAAGRTTLFVCSQHGNESAGREMCLQVLRDLAFTDDPGLLAHLRDHTVMFVPTANPDGRAANTRGNANGQDLNRNNLNLTQPESRAVGRVLRDVHPVIVVDAHELSSASRPDLEVMWPRNLDVDRVVYDLSVEPSQEWVRPGAEAQGYSTGVYPGTGQERMLDNVSGLRHSLALLTETNQVNPPAQRVAVHRQTAWDVLAFHAAKADELTAATRAARERKAAAGAMQSEPYYLGGGDNHDPGPGDVLDPPPCGYRLTAEQLEQVATHVELFALEVAPSGEGFFVTMGQPMMTVVPLLLDGRATYNEAAGEPLDVCIDEAA